MAAHVEVLPSAEWVATVVLLASFQVEVTISSAPSSMQL
jgi:hypothetical protein